MVMVRSILTLVLTLIAFAVGAARAEERQVSPGAGTLARAIADALPGDVLRLRKGRYSGDVIVDRTLSIIGDGKAEVAGSGTGTALLVEAPDVRIEGLVVTGSGSAHETLDSGIKLTTNAPRAIVRGNTLRGNLHGIDVHGAVDSIVAENSIVGRTDHRMNERGNGIYLWNAPGSVIENNDIRLGRDGIFVNTSRRNVFRGNRLADLRFGIHYMYVNDSEVADNESYRNHLGYAIMYSTRVQVRGNSSQGDRDHGIMLNYAKHIRIEDNVVRNGGKKCLFMYNANRSALVGNHFENCPIGIHFTAGSQDNEIAGNAFIGNRTQVKYVGTKYQDWTADGRGNFWSDHAAFDVNGDGIADQTYRPNDRIDQVLWTQPAARFLLGSPALQLIRWAQKEFPALLPGGVVDTKPLMKPEGNAGKEAS